MSRTVTGAKVKLLRDLTTRGGIRFRKGLVMRVIDGNRSGFALYVYVRGNYRSIHSVQRYDFEVLEWPKRKEDD